MTTTNASLVDRLPEDQKDYRSNRGTPAMGHAGRWKFGRGNGLEPGMNAEIVLEWPRLLDGHIRLQLVLEATITGSQEGVAEARILAYQFRTRGSAEAEQRMEPASMKVR